MELNGLILNSNVGEYPKNSWRFAKNVILSSDLKAILNENGFSTQFNHNMIILNVTDIGNRQIVCSSDETLSEIGIITDGIYSTIIKDVNFAFNLNYPIKVVGSYNHKNQLIIAFTDDYNTPKILNVDDLPFPSGLNEDYSLVNSAEFTLCELYPNLKNPVLDTVTVLDTGGSLVSGVYFVTMHLV
jgi:hypothetical protein